MVYVDLLVIENFILNYCILIAVSIILNRVTKIYRIIFSSSLGSIPLIFLFIDIDKIYLFIVSLLFSFIMSSVAFKYQDIIYTLKNIIYMYLASIFLAGSIYLININILPKVDNTFLKFIILIILSPIITIIYIKSIKKINNTYNNYYQIDIYLKDKPKITLNSYLDTGNILKDPYFNRPIILVNKKKIDYHNEKILYVPYKTIDTTSLLKCIKPTKIYINNLGYRKHLLIGIIDEIGIEGAECILNKDLL